MPPTVPSRLFGRGSWPEARRLADILRAETVGGVLLAVAAVLALAWANSPWSDAYAALSAVRVGPAALHLDLTLAQWASDGLLAIFFFVAGLELKREFVAGDLRNVRRAVLPVAAAVGGMVLPALAFIAVNAGSPENLAGWAIPTATDIAFALAVLSVVGTALPAQLRAFLLTLAVVDDLIVIVIIAVFYTSELHWGALAIAALLCAVYAVLQHFRVTTWLIYVPVVVAAWWFTHESGIHATIEGVVLGLLTRVRLDPGEDHSPAEKLEHRLVPWSAGVAVPFFALMSAGVVIGGTAGLFSDPVVIGVLLGLVVGTPLGVFGGAWLLCRLTRAEIDPDVHWNDVLGVAMLAGIGFTVALLVADLSFDGDEVEAAKTAVLLASLIAALLGAAQLGRRNRLHRGRSTRTGPHDG